MTSAFLAYQIAPDRVIAQMWGSPMLDPTPQEAGPTSEQASTVQSSGSGVLLLRAAALVGTLILVVVQASDLLDLQPRQSWGLIVLIAASLAIILTIGTLLPKEAGRLARHLDLLVPLGLYLPANARWVGWRLGLPCLQSSRRAGRSS